MVWQAAPPAPHVCAASARMLRCAQGCWGPPPPLAAWALPACCDRLTLATVPQITMFERGPYVSFANCEARSSVRRVRLAHVGADPVPPFASAPPPVSHAWPPGPPAPRRPALPCGRRDSRGAKAAGCQCGQVQELVSDGQLPRVLRLSLRGWHVDRLAAQRRDVPHGRAGRRAGGKQHTHATEMPSTCPTHPGSMWR